MSVEPIFDAMKRAVEDPKMGPELAKRAKGVIVYAIGDDVWTADLKSASPSIYRGEPRDGAKPDLRVTVAANTFLDLAMGKLKAQAAFMRGLVKIRGNMALAMKLDGLINAARAAGFDAAPGPAAAAPSATAVPASAGAAVFDALREALKDQGAELVKKVAGVIEFNLTKPDTVWTLDLKSGNGSLVEGKGAGRADLTITVSDSDFADLASGKLKAQAAFMRGKIKVRGSMALAMKLSSVFEAARKAKL
jgi:putative sterol carrier protein